jgi:hypothetical protein
MASLQYGNIVLGLQGLLATERYEREALIEGGNFVGQQHRITVRGYFNPFSVSAQGQPGGDPTTPIIGSGNRPPITDAALRFMLQQPRQSLIYISGNTVVLQSPNPNASMDARTGPYCTVNRIMPQLGEAKTWIVDATFTCVTMDCPPISGLQTLGAIAKQAIMSNNWEMSQTIDADGLTIRTYNGKTTLRTDIMASGGLTADDFRPFILPATFPNCRREVTQVTQMETADQYAWTVRDVELMSNIRAAGVTRMTGIHWAEVTTVDWYQQAREFIDTGIEWLGRTLEEGAKVSAEAGAIQNALGVGEGQALLAAGGTALRGVAALSRLERSTIPTVAIGVALSVFGRRDCSRKTLERFAIQIANLRFANSLGSSARFLAGKQVKLTHHITERQVNLVAVMRSTITGYSMGFYGLGFDLSNVSTFFPDGDDTQVTPNKGIFSQTTFPGLGLVNNNGAAGSFIGEVIAAALTSPCSGVSSPAVPGNAAFSPQVGPNSQPAQP